MNEAVREFNVLERQLRRYLGPAKLAGQLQIGLPARYRNLAEFQLCGRLPEGVSPPHRHISAELRSHKLRSMLGLGPRWGTTVMLAAESLEQPGNILELGTGFGFSALYLASSSRCGRLVSIEEKADRHQGALALLGDLLGKVELRCGKFAEHLGDLNLTLDLVFFDASKTWRGLERDLRAVEPWLRPGALLIWDDIRWNGESYQFWKSLAQDRRFSEVVDMARMGMARWCPGPNTRVFNWLYPWERLWGWWQLTGKRWKHQRMLERSGQLAD